MRSRSLAVSVVSLVLFANWCDVRAASAAEPAAALSALVNNDTFLVACFDIATMSSDEDPAKLIQLVPSLPAEVRDKFVSLALLGGVTKRLNEAGVQTIYVVAGLADIHDQGGPLLAATAVEPGRISTVEQALNDLVTNIQNDIKAPGQQRSPWPLEVRRQGDVLLVGTKYTVDRYASLQASQRNDLLDPLRRLRDEGAVLAGVFAPGPDFRRVVRELWPTLPPPLAPLNGELADRWRSLELAVNKPPQSNRRITLEAADPAAAQTFADLYRAIPDAVEKFHLFGGNRDVVLDRARAIVSKTSPQIDGSRATIRLGAGEPEIEILSSELVDAAMESSRRARRLNQFKQMLLAVMNYADTNKHLPPAAICDKDGRPLLSWRVAILPYLDEMALYKEFHLDEPWDSPHNRQLVERMPAMYADPSPRVRRAAGKYKTTFQVPVAAETVFYNNEGATFKDISDGTSRTILLVEVEPSRAVEWTKPDDWQVDLAHPRQGIERTDRDRFTAGFADAHVSLFPTGLDDATFRAMLTRAGQETFEWP